jgi:hypothetical protein
MKTSILILGDILAIGILTIIGFATHGEAELSLVPRMATTFFPLSISWFLLAPALGLFQQEMISNPKNLWRPALVGLFAGPFAAVLRGFMLNAPIIPIFAMILSATSALGLLVWRAIFVFLNRKVR